MDDNYSILIRKLDEFIRKYYKNILIRGLLLFVGLFFLFFLIVSLTEYFGHFNSLARTILFYTYLAINLAVLGWLIITPLMKLLRIGKIISHEEAARIIGTHFVDVEDKLLNVIQLREMKDDSPAVSRELIEASINQKIEKLRPVPFRKAIDLKLNRKYLKYAVPPVILFLLILISAPSVVTEPANRLVNHGAYFEKPLPFNIFITNKELKGIQQEDFRLEVRVEGEELPAEIFLESGGLKYRLIRESPVKFFYDFVNLQEDKAFHILANEYRSPEYLLKVLPRPIVLGFETIMDYPGYTGKSDETLENTGDLVVPEGTGITWRFFTRDTKSVFFTLKGKTSQLQSPASNTFTFSETIGETSVYSVSGDNEFMKSRDSLTYSITVIPDLYPSVMVEAMQDSIFDTRLYFKGMIKDDYGFKELTFNYIHLPQGESEGTDATVKQQSLPISGNMSQQQFFHFFDLDSVNIQPGDEVEYYFEVWDNDAVNGSKSSRSQKMIFKAPTAEEIEKQDNARSEQLQGDMEGAIEDLKELQKEIDELTRKLAEKESLGWQEKQELQKLIDKQKEIEKTIENIQKENELKSMKEEQYKEIDEELLRKQQELEKLFNEVMTDEMKKMFEELQNLLVWQMQKSLPYKV